MEAEASKQAVAGKSEGKKKIKTGIGAKSKINIDSQHTSGRRCTDTVTVLENIPSTGSVKKMHRSLVRKKKKSDGIIFTYDTQKHLQF